jgi:short-subunit dehydrogenase
LVLVSRNEPALHELCKEVRKIGGDAIYVVADVGREDQVHHVAQVAIRRFSGFDTWINNAGTSLFGHLIDVDTEDHRRLFDTNFWGVVYGSLEAARHFRERDGRYGGTLINVGSILSDRAIPIQGMYCASKFAVKGFTDALRMELEEEGVPASICLVKPSSTDTPFPQHARNYMDEEPTLPPPVYAPDVVARTILHCCESPEREVIVGGSGKAISSSERYLPRLTDKLMEAVMPAAQKKGVPPKNPAGALHSPTFGLQERGEYPGYVLGSSLYTTLALHGRTIALSLGAGLAIAALVGLGLNNRQT